MNQIDRTKVKKTECLVVNAEKWTSNYIEKRKTKPSYWNWHQYGGTNVEHILTDLLSGLTKKHCSYCGIYPLEQNVGGRSIDHFKPKSRFPKLSFEWTNLFIACSNCQKAKGSDFPEINPLKFDNNYEFDFWFDIEYKTGKIIPNPERTPEEKGRAEATLIWLGINKVSRPAARLNELKHFKSSTLSDIWRWSYPYFLEQGMI